MKAPLLLGAGFSRNWGGWLASEAFEYLLGTREVLADHTLRTLLWKHQRQGGFEDALAELQLQASRSGAVPDLATLNAMQSAVLSMFTAMNRALHDAAWERTNDASMQVGRLLARFSAIFTLNQDTLLERHYVPNVHSYGHPRIHSAALPGMRRIPGTDPMHSHQWDASTWVPEGELQVASATQPIYKLHGSSNWFADGGTRAVIIGGEKARQIQRNRVLSRYFEVFESELTAGARLMVIGYGFRDDHINRLLIRAGDHGMKMFVIDPLGGSLADTLNPTRGRAHIICGTELETFFEKALIGASRRPLLETFSRDHAEHEKVMRFLE